MNYDFGKKRDEAKRNKKDNLGERIFEDFMLKICPQHEFQRLGFDHFESEVEKNQYWEISQIVRSMPDYFVSKKKKFYEEGDKPLLVEVKSFRGTFDLKQRDMDAYKFWQEHSALKVQLFVFKADAPQHCFMLKLDDVCGTIQACEGDAIETGIKDGKKKFYAIPVEVLEKISVWKGDPTC